MTRIRACATKTKAVLNVAASAMDPFLAALSGEAGVVEQRSLSPQMNFEGDAKNE